MANEKKTRRHPKKSVTVLDNLPDSLSPCLSLCLPVSVRVFKVFWNIPTKEKWSGGEWKVESGEWRVESGEWRVESGEWKVDIPRGVLSPLGHTPVAYTVIPLWAAAHSYLSVCLSVCGVCPRL